MLSLSIFVPFPFAISAPHCQEPTSIDTPTGSNAGAGPAGTTVPGGPNAAPSGAAPAGGFGNDIFLFMAIFVALMLFMTFRRESKARKAQQAMISSIKQGDRVVTTSGIHGTVHRLEDATVTLLLDSVKVTFERSAITRVVRDTPAAKTA